MPIKTRCPGCRKEYTLSDALAGKRVRCKKCSETFLVRAPAPVAQDEVDEEPEPVRPRRAARRRAGDESDQGRLPARSRGRKWEEEEEQQDEGYEDESEEEERPRRRPRPKSGGGGMPVWGWVTIGVVALVLLLGGTTFLIVHLVGGGGGNSKVNTRNFAKIQAGMSEQQVRDILGSPSDSNDTDINAKTMTWENGEYKIRIIFRDGKALGLQEVTPVKR
jgi:predicted Zn finger-like uncharacterized protein